MCSLRSIPFAVLATTPRSLAGSVLSGPGARRGRRAAVTIALLRSASKCPSLDHFRRRFAATAPQINVPFLLPDDGVPQRQRQSHIVTPGRRREPRLETSGKDMVSKPEETVECQAEPSRVETGTRSGDPVEVTSTNQGEISHVKGAEVTPSQLESESLTKSKPGSENRHREVQPTARETARRLLNGSVPCRVKRPLEALRSTLLARPEISSRAVVEMLPPPKKPCTSTSRKLTPTPKTNINIHDFFESFGQLALTTGASPTRVS